MSTSGIGPAIAIIFVEFAIAILDAAIPEKAQLLGRENTLGNLHSLYRYVVLSHYSLEIAVHLKI